MFSYLSYCVDLWDRLIYGTPYELVKVMMILIN